MGERYLTQFAFEYRGHKIGCFITEFKGFYTSKECWTIKVRGPKCNIVYNSKVICSSSTKDWAIHKGIEIVDNSLRENVFDYNEFFDRQEEVKFDTTERRDLDYGNEFE